MAEPDREVIDAVRAALATAGDPAKAPMQAYMKSAMPYYGVQTPALRAICRVLFAELVAERAIALSGLSKREALKNIGA